MAMSFVPISLDSRNDPEPHGCSGALLGPGSGRTHMQHAVSMRTPAHLWIVGILSLLWNCFGAYDYTMTRLKNTDYLSQMGDPNVVLAYIDGMPMYAQFGWGLGVWGALLGSVLLLMRSRYAVHAFAAS